MKNTDDKTVMYKLVRGLRGLAELDIRLEKLIQDVETENITKKEMIKELKEIKHNMFGL